MEAEVDQPRIQCVDCGFPYPPDGIMYHCPKCGGLFDYFGQFRVDRTKVDWKQPGIWRYYHSFNLPKEVKPVSLGEGNTPLVRARIFGRDVGFKCEYLNPSGSFKDRGSTVIVGWLAANGVKEAVEDSSGNAGASLAAYAARAGIKVHIYVPETASGPKLRQIDAYGADLVPVTGSRSEVSQKVKKIADSGMPYASHAYLPFNLAGYATAAYEIVEQLGTFPGTVIVPAGQGGFLLGLSRGFAALNIERHPSHPKIVGVQAMACAPLWAEFTHVKGKNNRIEDGTTLAEGVRVSEPLRRNQVMESVTACQGLFAVVSEEEILAARDQLAHMGFYVEPTSAIVLPALKRYIKRLPDPIILILTGSGMKYG